MRERAIVFVLLALSTGLSTWMVSAFVEAPGGYAAAYSTGGAYVFASIFAISGLAWIPWRRWRWLGLTLLVSGTWLIGSYLGAVNTLYRLDLVPWKTERMVSLLPARGNGYYIYFRRGTSDAQIEDFIDRLIFEPPTSHGRSLKRGVRSFARMTPVDDRETIAVGLSPDLGSRQRQALRVRLQSEPIVAQVSESPLAKSR